MADRPEDSVVDANGEVFRYPGLYMTDGAAVPTSLGVNSSLTILANAERIAARWSAFSAPKYKFPVISVQFPVRLPAGKPGLLKTGH